MNGRCGPVRHEVTHDGRRLRIVLDAGKGNVLDTRACNELAGVLGVQSAGRRLRAVTLEATGDHFSFGASVPEHTPQLAEQLLRGLHRVVRSLVDLDLPVIAAVQGCCLGGGLEIVLPCQRIVAAPGARFGQPEVTLGMFAPAGSAILPERVGRGMAEDLLLSGRVVDAQEALRIGLADQIADHPPAAALAWAEEHLFPKSGMALRFATRAARASYRRRVHSALLALEGTFLDELMQTKDAHEGVASFVEKRPPKWTDA